MADLSDFGNVATNWVSGASEILGVLIPILVIGGLILFIVWYFLEQKKYNKLVVILRATNNNNFQFFTDKAKAFRDKNGVDAWRLKKLKKRVDVPPDDSINTTTKGQLIAYAIYDSNQQITFVSPKVSYDAYKTGLNFEPITTQSKANYAYEVQYNRKLRSTGWKENMPLIIGGFTLVVLVMATLFFTPKLYEAQEKVSLAQAEASSKIAQSVEKLDTIINGQQEIIQGYENQEGVTRGVSPNE